MDALNKSTNPCDIGKAKVLPAKHPGCPRQMLELYLDAMAIVGHYGKPDLFLTMTCNPKWPEIQRGLFSGQQAKDRPDLICDIFKLKMDNLIDEIINKSIFGKVRAFVWVIEFQKRGLPHLHMLIILDEESKIRTKEDIDAIISAEIPKNKESNLYKNVMKHMIHLPCDSKFSKCIKNQAGKCSKRFPKEFQETTDFDEDSYPLYRRRNFGEEDYTYGKSKIKVDNSYVVPYNPYLLCKYNCHINVEVCSTIKAVKYLYKYIYKGYDRALVEIKNNDEIEHYINSRYVSSIEAYWKIKGYKLNDKYPKVLRMAVHLENHQSVAFKSNEEIKTLLEKNYRSQLIAWFESNQNVPEFRHRKKTKDKSAIKVNEDIVVRPYFISVQETEKFFLKIILKHAVGATNFDCLKTYNGKKYETFRQVVKAMGLLDDDDIWIETLKDAVLVNCNAFKLRKLFANILAHCEVIQPERLWHCFKQNLSDDLYKNFPKLSKEEIERKILIEIDKNLDEHHLTIQDFNLSPIKIEYEIDSGSSNSCEIDQLEMHNFSSLNLN